MKKSVLVTGATGFSGQYLCRLLSRKGYRVVGTSTASSGRRGCYTQVRLDVSDEFPVRKLIRALRPSFICHLAAESNAALSWRDPQKTFRVNTAGTVYLLNALRAYSQKSRMLFISSNQVYGRSFANAKPVREEDSLWPQNPYSTSKALAELACLNFAKQFGLDIVIARPTNHAGAGQSAHFVFSDWCRQIAKAEKGFQEPQLRVGNLEVSRDFLHVQDVAEAYEILLRKGAPGEIYNISCGRTVLLRKYLEFLLKKSRIPLRVCIQKERVRSGDIPQMRTAAAKMKALGWTPARTAFEALEGLLGYWRTKV